MHHAAVSRALQPVNAGYRRKALYFLHGEDRGTVHHAVNHQSVLPGVNVGEMLIAEHQEMERGWCDDSYRILKRSQVSRPRGAIYTVRAYTGLVARTPAV